MTKTNRNKLNYVITKQIRTCFKTMCKQIDLIDFLQSDLKMPKEFMQACKNYKSIDRKLKYQMKKYPLKEDE